jgi:uncharacterized protein
MLDPKAMALLAQLDVLDLSPERRKMLRDEILGGGTHSVPGLVDETAFTPGVTILRNVINNPYAFADLSFLQGVPAPHMNMTARMGTLEDLMARDARREEDGLPRKIRIGKLVKPGSGGKDKVVVVPSTVEEKFMHDSNFNTDDEGEGAGGSGEGDEGEVIGEQPVRPQEGEGEGTGPGEGDGANHEIESNAYELGRILTEQFSLPNLQDKGKKRSLTKFTYDLTDLNRGFGQFLEKKATMKRMVRTNIALGRIKPGEPLDPTEFLISPRTRCTASCPGKRTLKARPSYFSCVIIQDP